MSPPQRKRVGAPTTKRPTPPTAVFPNGKSGEYRDGATPTGSVARATGRVGKRLGPNPDYDRDAPRSDPTSAKWLYACAAPGCHEPRDVSGPVLPWNRARWPKLCAAHREAGAP
jgi:hypothetical protein